jgi:hypothetical protein
LPCDYHVIAMSWSCSIAMLLPCYCHAISMLLS